MYFAFETDAATILLSLGCGTCNPKPFGDGILFVDSHIQLGLPGIEWVIGEIIGREKLVDSGLSAL